MMELFFNKNLDKLYCLDNDVVYIYKLDNNTEDMTFLEWISTAKFVNKNIERR